MTENIIRKSKTGEPGNAGEFGTVPREEGPSLVITDRGQVNNPETSVETLKNIRDKSFGEAEALRNQVQSQYSREGSALRQKAIDTANTGLIAAGKVAHRESDGDVSEGEGRLVAAADQHADVWNYGMGYWDRVEVARDPRTSTAALGLLLDRESEDDFMLAIAGHANANAVQIERASQHHATAVRMAALDNANTATSTLVRIENDAIAEELDAAERLRREGVSPMQKHIASEVESASALSSYARAKINARMWP